MKILSTKYTFALLTATVSAVFIFCSSDDDGDTPEPQATVFDNTGYRYSDVGTDNGYTLTYENLQSPEENQLESSSGIVGSQTNGAYVIICEGAGNPNVLHVYNRQAEFVGKIIVEGAENIDWQDIAAGPGPDDGAPYLYIGDIGDRGAVRDFLSIYRLREPDLSALEVPFEINAEGVDKIDFTVNAKRDFQTLMVDPESKDLIVMGTMQAMTYRLRFPQSTSGVTAADFKGHHMLRREIKGGDISPDRRHIIIKDVGEVFKWEIPDGDDPVRVMFEDVPVKVPYVAEIEGGALGWTSDSQTYFTITDTDITDNGVRRGQPVLRGYTRD